MKSKQLILGYRLLVVLLAFIGVLNSLMGRNTLETLIFFTIQSNLLGLIIMSLMVYYGLKGKSVHEKAPILFTFKHIITMNLLITFLGFHFLLRPTLIGNDPTGYLTSIENILNHYVVPIMFIIDYLVFDEKGTLTLKKIPLFLIYPYGYLVFVIIRAEIGGMLETVDSRYPYFFVDLDYLGFGIVYYVLGMTLFFSFMALLFSLYDQRFKTMK